MPDYTPVTYTGNGSTKTYSITFSDYLKQSNVTVKVDGVLKTNGGPGTYDYTIDDATKVVTFTTAPLNGATILIERVTPTDLSTNEVEFSSGGDFNEVDMNDVVEQSLLIDQELKYADSQLDSRISTLEGSTASDESATFNTVALLNANTTIYADGKVGVVKGYYNELSGDFGPNVICDRDDTSSSADGLSIFVDAIGQRWKRVIEGPVNVKWAGAKGDFDWQYWRNSTYANVVAQTNDTVAIQAAINYAQTKGTGIFIPSGIYKITSSLVNKLRPIDIIGERRVIPIGDMSGDTTIDQIRGTILIRHVDPGSTATPAISSYFPIITQRGAITSDEWDEMNGGSGGTWDSTANLLKNATISDITFVDVRSGSDYSVPNYAGSDHYAAGVLWHNTQHCRLERCEFATHGRGLEVKRGDDGYVHHNFFNCGAGYNTSKAYANSTGAIYLHRELTNSYKSTNTFDIQWNLFEGNYCMDFDMGGDGTDSESQPLSALQIKNNFFKIGGNDYYRTRRGRFYRVNSSGREIHLEGQLKTSLGSSATSEEMWLFDQFNGGTIIFGPCYALDSSNSGLSNITSLAKFQNCSNEQIPVKNANYTVETKFTGSYLIEVDSTSDPFIDVEDNPDWTAGVALAARRLNDIASERVLSLPPKFTHWATYGTSGSPQIVLQPAGNFASVGTGDFSVEVWQYVPSTNLGSSNIGIWRVANTASQTGFDNAGFAILIDSAGKPSIKANTGATTATADKVITAGWHHFVFTRTGTTGKLYIDGSEWASQTEANWGTTVPTSASFIGSYGSNHNTGGRVAQFRIYGDDLSASEVFNLYALGGYKDDTGYSASGIICDLDFIGAGNFFKDLSGNKMHGWSTDDVTRSLPTEIGIIEHTNNFTADAYMCGNFNTYINEVPAGYTIDKIYVLNNGTGTSNLDVENGSGGNIIVSAISIGSGYNDEVALNLPDEPTLAAAQLYIEGSNWTNQDFNVRVIIRKWGI